MCSLLGTPCPRARRGFGAPPTPMQSLVEAALSRPAAGCGRSGGRDGARACVADVPVRSRAARRGPAPQAPSQPVQRALCSRRAALRALSLAAAGGWVCGRPVRGASTAASASLRSRAATASADAESGEAAFFMPPTRVTAPGRIVALGDLHGDMAQARARVPRQAPCNCAARVAGPDRLLLPSRRTDDARAAACWRRGP